MRAPAKSLPSLLATLVANSAAITTVNTAVLSTPASAIPAGSLQVGSEFRIKAQATNSSTGVPTIKAHIGAAGTVSDANIVSINGPAVAGELWIEMLLTIRTLGGSGTSQGSATVIGAAAPAAAGFNTVAGPTVSSLVSNIITLAVSTTTGTITVKTAIIEQLA